MASGTLSKLAACAAPAKLAACAVPAKLAACAALMLAILTTPALAQKRYGPGVSDTEGKIYARYILSTLPNAKIGILSQNDDLGRDYLLGFKRGLGDKASTMIVSSQTYNTSDPTVDSQVVTLKASGADVFFIVSVPKFSAQAIRKAYDIDWHPQEFVSSDGSSIAGAIRPSGFEAAKGIISAAYQKDPADPQWKDDPAMKAWNVWMDKYNPRVDRSDYYAPYGYNVGFAVVQLLKQCGDDLTRA